jgi:subtilisin-like proprotein convertase family protein
VQLNSQGATANVTVGFYAADANALPAGIHTDTVDFTNQIDPGRGDTARTVTLDVGRYSYTSTDVPKPIADNTTITSTLVVNDFFCVGDVNVDLNITHTYIGDLVVELKSPENTIVRLHNRTGGTAEDIVAIYDDGVRNPDGPGLLADFNGENPVGTWTLTVSDQAGSDVGTLNSWSLKIATAGSHCPPVAQNTTATVPVCNLVSIPLTGLSSLGSGMDHIVDSLPAKGQLYDPAAGPITTVPYTVMDQGDYVIYRPSPAQSGSDSFTFHVDDSLPSNTATANLTIDAGARSEQYNWNLDVDPGWTKDTGWAFGVPTGSGSPSKDPTSGHTGSNVYGYNLNGNYSAGLPARNLTTTAIDCTALQSTQIRFWRWLGVEGFDDAKVQVSNNGSSWTTVWDNPSGSGQSIGDAAWVEMQLDIAAVADGQPTVYVRWTMGPTDISGNYPGWNIDDVTIWALRPGYALTYEAMSACLMGPEAAINASCGCADRDGDLDVDLADFGILQEGN